MKRLIAGLIILTLFLVAGISFAAVAVTHVRTLGTVDSDEIRKDVTIAMDASYTGSGGEALAASALGYTTVYSGFCDPSGGYVFQYDKANSKLKAFWTSNSVDGEVLPEVTATTDMSAQTAVSCRFTGK